MKCVSRRELVLGGLATLAARGAASAPAAPRPCVGWVEELSGTVEWRADSHKPFVKLKPGRDRYKALRTGDQLRWDRGARVVVTVNARRHALTPAPGPYVVPPPKRLASRADEAAHIYVRRTGAERGGDGVVISPDDDERVLPAEFTVRWNHRPGLEAVSLIVTDTSGMELWRGPVREGASSSADPAARQALRDYRRSHGSATLKLTLIDSSGAEHAVSFRLLSPEEETALEGELASAPRGAGLLGHLMRIRAYMRRQVYFGVDRELQSALREAPESHDLLAMALDFYRFLGDADRVAELTRRLLAAE